MRASLHFSEKCGQRRPTASLPAFARSGAHQERTEHSANRQRRERLPLPLQRKERGRDTAGHEKKCTKREILKIEVVHDGHRRLDDAATNYNRQIKKPPARWRGRSGESRQVGDYCTPIGCSVPVLPAVWIELFCAEKRLLGAVTLNPAPFC